MSVLILDSVEEQIAAVRLDRVLVERRLARSRSQAHQLILAGAVSVDGRTITKPAHGVYERNNVTLIKEDPYVSRAAHKLIAALNLFSGIRVEGSLALDVGASTGGFSQVLLERGAELVLAIDVGHDQMAEKIRNNVKVRLVEGYNARYMNPASLQEATGVSQEVDLVVADISFISLTMVISAMKSCASKSANYVLLVKPQFEVGRTSLSEGIVKNQAERARGVKLVIEEAMKNGLGVMDLVASPILGGAGNHEYLLWLNVKGSNNLDYWSARAIELAERNRDDI